LHVWFEGLKVGQDLYFNDSSGKPHHLLLLSISTPNDAGISICRYVLDSEFMSCEVQVRQPSGNGAKSTLMADTANKYHVAAPSNGDLWVMYVHPGDVVKAGEELFNVSIMKQEKAVLAPIDGMVKRVLKTADFKETSKWFRSEKVSLLWSWGLCRACAAMRPAASPFLWITSHSAPIAVCA
jgi:Pyruvate carboxylase